MIIYLKIMQEKLTRSTLIIARQKARESALHYGFDTTPPQKAQSPFCSTPCRRRKGLKCMHPCPRSVHKKHNHNTKALSLSVENDGHAHLAISELADLALPLVSEGIN
ncbi:unnamed protein product [Strongylus vulgaris]|uniref:Uncharacterized protein n=1 Tax=Strongylus vulgaris TaxID=40348 RepID=A0A3P7JQA2_STRVU|nr:unnamed protein product [Strongylus vulgaris]